MKFNDSIYYCISDVTYSHFPNYFVQVRPLNSRFTKLIIHHFLIRIVGQSLYGRTSENVYLNEFNIGPPYKPYNFDCLFIHEESKYLFTKTSLHDEINQNRICIH